MMRIVHGILPLMPMPKHIDTEALIDMLDPKKDIDGLTTYNIGLVTVGKGLILVLLLRRAWQF